MRSKRERQTERQKREGLRDREERKIKRAKYRG